MKKHLMNYETLIKITKAMSMNGMSQWLFAGLIHEISRKWQWSCSLVGCI